MTRRISARGIVAQNGKLLAVKLNANKNVVSRNYWCTIGGGVDDGESLLDAIKREMVEETGIKPEVGRLLFVQQFSEPAKDREHLEFFFEITNSNDYIDVELEKSSHGVDEIAEIEFIDPTKEHVLPKFLQEIDYQNLPNQPLFFSYL